VREGYSPAECGTYYHDAGTWVTMRTLAGTSSTTLVDNFGLLKGIQESSASNAPLMNAAEFWLPGRTYSSSLAPVGTEKERADLRAQVIDNAGAGKLP
jgi:hypothetical protein